eukprot:SAG22_NODE_19996_length_269_cov_1.217647_1_plen_50_part_01
MKSGSNPAKSPTFTGRGGAAANVSLAGLGASSSGSLQSLDEASPAASPGG